LPEDINLSPDHRETRDRQTLKRMAVGLVVLLFAGALYQGLTGLFRNDTQLTIAELDEARARWEGIGPENYNLEVQFESSDATMSIRIQVRNNEVTTASSDTRAMNKEEARRWTVPAQFDRMRNDVLASGDPTQGLNIREHAYLIPKAAFDAEFGYPTHYEFKGEGTPLQYQWRVVKFEPVSTNG
jgi:hypothetical protein